MSKSQTSNDGEHSLIEDQDNKLSVEDQDRLEIFSNLIDSLNTSVKTIEVKESVEPVEPVEPVDETKKITEFEELFQKLVGPYFKPELESIVETISDPDDSIHSSGDHSPDFLFRDFKPESEFVVETISDSVDEEEKIPELPEVYSKAITDPVDEEEKIPELPKVYSKAITDPAGLLVPKAAERTSDIIQDIVSTLDNLNSKTEVKEEVDQIAALRDEFGKFRNHIQQHISHQDHSGAGSGEVRLEFLDDIQRSTAKVDGKFLKYSSSDSKWIGADASGGSSAADDISAGDAAVNITTTSGNITIDAAANNTDIIFKGTDGGSDITILTLDGSEAGAATFNSTVTTTGLTIGSTAVTSTADELNILDGVTSTAAEINLLDGITAGTASASKAVILDSNKDITGFRNLTIAGDLVVSGTTKTVDTVTMEAANAVIFEGATADDYETTLTIVDPTADHTQYLINQTGYIPLLAASTTTAISSTPAELNLIDGGTSRGTTAVASGDGILINDAGTMAMTNVDTVSTYFASHSVGGGNIVTTGALDSGSITSGFGNINIGSSTITTSGAITGGSIVIGSADISEAELEILDGANVTTTELNLIDGGTSRGTTAVASGDGILINDAGTMAMTNVDTVSTYFASHSVGGGNIVTTGALDAGSITSGFGTIDTGASTITTTGLISGGSLDIDNVLINGATIGHTDDTDLMTVADGLLTVAGEISVTTLDIGGTNVTTTAAEINLIDGGTARGTTAVASGDGILINDAGTMAMTNVDTVSTYFASHSVGGGNIVTTGALNSGSITSGFGTIDTGSSAITTTGLISGGSLDIDNVLINGTTIGHTDDTDLLTLADGALTAKGTITVGVDNTGHDVKFFGASAGAYMEWDESADQLRIVGASADAVTSTGKLLLATALTDINANDVIGKIDFQAPLEAGGTDAITVAASIQALAQGTFSSSVNATDLIFYTGHSEAATEKFRFTSQGELGVGGANYGSDGQVLTSGGAGAAAAWEDASGGSGGSDPSSADGDSLGIASKEWSDLFLAEGGIIYFGNDQDVTLTHDPDDGLFLKSIATADNSPVLLTLQTGETDMAANDVLGKIAFQAPDEGTGTDAVLVAAAIQARSEGDFSSSANATSIDFMTGSSEAAATKWSITSGGSFLNAGTNTIDMNAGELILDADADTTITADTDDTIDIKIAGADDFQFTANTFTALSGSGVVIPDGGLTLGSTAVSSTAAELNKLDALSRGSVLIGNASAVTTILTKGTADQVLTSDGTDIAWAAASGGSDPASADGDTLGTASLEWSDLYLADGGVIFFGNDQDVTVTHDPDDGLFLKSIATADNNPVLLTLQTGETDIAADDVIGKIAFQAPDEGTGTDAVLVAAAIQARSEGDFSSSANATAIDFMTGVSEAAATKMTLSSAGNLGLHAGNLVIQTSGKGIDFSATDDATDTSEILTDYEEGTWTPALELGISSPGYSRQVGFYTKIGNVVTANGRLDLDGSGTANSSHFGISGLPYTSANQSPSNYTVATMYINACAGNGEDTFLLQYTNSTILNFFTQTETSVAQYPGTSAGVSFVCLFQIVYKTEPA